VHPLDKTLRRAESAIALQRSQPYAFGPAVYALRALANGKLDERALANAEGYATQFGASTDAAGALYQLACDAPLRHFVADEVILREGERSYGIYIVYSGRVRVERDGAGILARLDEGQSFGEIAVIAETPRTASVVADGGCSVLVLERKALALAVNRVGGMKKMLRHVYRDRVLSQLVPPDSCFSALDTEQRHALFALFAPRTWKTGETVVEQGSPGDGFYVILAGEAEVWRDGSRRAHLARLGPGDFFGEISLIDDVPTTATVRASAGLTCFHLERAAFHRSMRDLPEQLQRVRGVARDRLAQQHTGPETLPPGSTMSCPACAFDQPAAPLCAACGADVMTARPQMLGQATPEPMLGRED
jgi:CRP-like cAMP-binding protein